ncbi:MAG: class I SAM-dependent methyltransferase [Solirubrobacteraceae bacterium]
MTDSAADPAFRYPTADGVIRSVEEYRSRYLPAQHDPAHIGTRIRRTVGLLCDHAGEEPRRVLDYGCGTGWFLYHLSLRRPAWSLEGWDGDPSSMAIARGCFAADNIAYRDEPYDAHLQLNDQAEATFDVITFLEVLEHVTDPQAILSSFHEGLRPGGLVVVSTPYALGYGPNITELRRRVNLGVRRRSNDGYAKLLRERPYDPTTNNGHVASYTPDTLATLLSVSGFTALTFALSPITRAPLRRLLPETLIMVARKETRP